MKVLFAVSISPKAYEFKKKKKKFTEFDVFFFLSLLDFSMKKISTRITNVYTNYRHDSNYLPAASGFYLDTVFHHMVQNKKK